MKFEPHTGREFGAKLVESVKEIEDGGFTLAFGAVKGGVDDFLAQKLPAAFNQVQVGRIRRQEDLHEALIDQPGGEGLVLVVAGVGADDVYRALRVGGEQFLVEPLGALGIDAVSFVEVDLGGPGWGSGRCGRRCG